MSRVEHHRPNPAAIDWLDAQSMLSPFKDDEWLSMTPAERLARAWALRDRLVDPQAVHDRKLFPAP